MLLNIVLVTREHCIQRITFAAETNAACSQRSGKAFEAVGK